MKFLLTLLLIFPILGCLAQSPPVSPPVSDSGTLRQDTDKDVIYTNVEIEAEYPGGQVAWSRYLAKNLRYPSGAMDAIVMVQFIVDRQGKLSDIQAIAGPAAYRHEAVRVVRASKRWTPAMQNSYRVKSIVKIPIEIKVIELKVEEL